MFEGSYGVSTRQFGAPAAVGSAVADVRRIRNGRLFTIAVTILGPVPVAGGLAEDGAHSGRVTMGRGSAQPIDQHLFGQRPRNGVLASRPADLRWLERRVDPSAARKQ